MDLDVSADHAVEVFQTAAEENQVDPRRKAQVITLPPQGEVWMTGDIHDHRNNFQKLLRAADLSNNPQRHLVLHELIHGDHYDAAGAEDSWQMLFRAAELKCDFPGQVHFLLANHDLAQIHGEGISKAGQNVCEAFTAGVKRDFPGESSSVNVAIAEFLLSLPLAIRCPNGLLFCHSLPTDDQIPDFDYAVFDRTLTGPDYRRRTGPVYQLIWGRGISAEGATQFADRLNASATVTGHQPQESGYLLNGDRHLIIASDHNQGVVLPIDLSKKYDANRLARKLVKINALAADWSEE